MTCKDKYRTRYNMILFVVVEFFCILSEAKSLKKKRIKRLDTIKKNPTYTG